ncbi:ABC transporter substrate-binding protein [Ideonella sp. DXS22W]|uniref:ABC transporter substrate-binding protein n=1 Tax=Pseudaquabacterium inlustre TaxID=2984192 RepID=A0ABU9CQ91_9BURK
MSHPVRTTRRAHLLAIAAAATSALLPGVSQAQKKYDPGASDTEIKIGHTIPYSGPASAYGAQGKAIAAWFQKVNDEGGVNGRKLKLISMDDAYNPAKTVEAVRKLVEQDEVLFIGGALGTPQNAAIQKYLNAKKVPQLFVSSGASRWNDPKNFPYTMGIVPSYHTEGSIYAEHILKNKPGAKIAVLFQNDDFGKDYLKGFLDGLGDKAKTMVVGQQSYEVTDPTVDSQLVSLKATGADTFFNITTPKFAAQAIRKLPELGWKPVHYLASVSGAVSSTLKPAGLENSIGIITCTYLRDPADLEQANTPEVAAFTAWMKKYNPGADPTDMLYVSGQVIAQAMVEVLKKAGDNLTRENIMKVAASLDTALPMQYPGVNLKTSADDFAPVERMRPQRFNGTRYETFGPVMGR